MAADPTYAWVPDYDRTNGDVAAQVGEALGLPPDEHQRAILDSIYAYRREAPLKPVCFGHAIVAPRQNIKTSTYVIAALTDLFVFRMPLHIWSAHQFKTARQTFMHMLELIEGNREFSRMCKKPVTANGKEAIRLRTGEEIQFHARSGGGGRGYTGPRVTMDEALFIVAKNMGALLPLMATMPDGQIRYASSAGKVMSEVLRGLRDRGRAGGDPTLGYFEWLAEQRTCARENCNHRPGTEGCALDDHELWAQANVALGRRILVSTLEELRREMPPDEFMCEFLGWWEDPVEGDSGLDPADYAAAKELGREAELADPVAIAFDVSPGQASTAIVAYGGTMEVLAHGPGTTWAIQRLVKLRDEWSPLGIGLDPTGPAGALIPELEKAGFKIRPRATKEHPNPEGDLVLLDGRESVQMCGAIHAALTERRLMIRPVDEFEAVLDDAIAGASRRMAGDAWKWSRKDSTADITALVAGTVAHWMWTQAPPPAKKKPATANAETAPAATSDVFRPKGRLKL